MTQGEEAGEPKDGSVVGALARLVDCFTEAEVCALFGITPGTAEAWRRRHQGPAYALCGNRFLYPRSLLLAFIDEQTRLRDAKDAKSQL